MSSYHSRFTYLNGDSAAYGLRIAAFTPDDGESDTFLDMEQVFTESYDGTKRHLYGLKYNSVATIQITVIKQDGSDFSLADNRKILKWLTGNRQASWLGLYYGTSVVPVYSFYGSFTTIKQQKIDAKIIGLVLTFESTTPWAYSSPQEVNCYFGEDELEIDDTGSIYKGIVTSSVLNIDTNGILYNSSNDINATFNIDDFGVVYNGEDVILTIENETDDLYTYINLDIVYTNKSGNETGNTLTINNLTLNEKTIITDISANEVVTLNSGQFITSNIYNKIFGDAFNFTWPRLRPGENQFLINGSGKGVIQFTFRYPMKIGDCAIDINNIINNPIGCENIPGDDISNSKPTNGIGYSMKMRIYGDYLQYTNDGITWANLMPVSAMAAAIGQHMNVVDGDVLVLGE